MCVLGVVVLSLFVLVEETFGFFLLLLLREQGRGRGKRKVLRLLFFVFRKRKGNGSLETKPREAMRTNFVFLF